MAIQFRCPHRPWVIGENGVTRQSKADARRTTFDAPADTAWVLVQHDIPAQKALRYKDELGHYWQADLVCPLCGDTITVTTDQNPEGA